MNEAPSAAVSTISPLHVRFMIASLLMTVVGCQTQHLETWSGIKILSSIDEKQTLKQELEGIIQTMKIDEHIFSTLNSLDAIKNYIQKKFQEKGKKIDIHIELDSSEIIWEDGVPFFSIVIGNPQEGTAISLSVKTQNITAKSALIQHFLESLATPFSEVMKLSREENIDDDDIAKILWIVLEKLREEFQNHKITPTSCSLAEDDDGNQIIILEYIDHSTGTKKTHIIPIQWKKENKRDILFI